MEQSKNNIEEVWKDVDGYEGSYQVSNLGRVRSLNRYIIYRDGVKHFKKGRVLVPQKDYHGYKIISFGRKNKKKIHRLVAMAFVKNPNPEEFNVVNHKDSNPSNNCFSNLEWCTQIYNIEVGLMRKRMKEVRSKPIVQCNRSGDTINEFSSIREASRLTGVNRWNITTALHKNNKKVVGGFLWKFKEKK